MFGIRCNHRELDRVAGSEAAAVSPERQMLNAMRGLFHRAVPSFELAYHFIYVAKTETKALT